MTVQHKIGRLWPIPLAVGEGILIPVEVYLLLTATGALDVIALTGSAAAAVIILGIGWLRTRTLNTLGILVLIRFIQPRLPSMHSAVGCSAHDRTIPRGRHPLQHHSDHGSRPQQHHWHRTRRQPDRYHPVERSTSSAAMKSLRSIRWAPLLT